MFSSVFRLFFGRFSDVFRMFFETFWTFLKSFRTFFGRFRRRLTLFSAIITLSTAKRRYIHTHTREYTYVL